MARLRRSRRPAPRRRIVNGLITIAPPNEPLALDGFVIRLPNEGDVDALVRFGDDTDTAETLWVPIPSPCSRAEAEGRLREFIEGWSGRSRFGPTFVVADAVSDEFVGIVFLRARDDATVEIAYGTAPQHRGRGIATRALRSVSDWCFEQQHAQHIELLISDGNHASCRVATKAGFDFSGIKRTQVPASGEQYDDLLYTRTA
jgi:RimJ/RimL family protein N-acetyltransferase